MLGGTLLEGFQAPNVIPDHMGPGTMGGGGGVVVCTKETVCGAELWSIIDI